MGGFCSTEQQQVIDPKQAPEKKQAEQAKPKEEQKVQEQQHTKKEEQKQQSKPEPKKEEKKVKEEQKQPDVHYSHEKKTAGGIAFEIDDFDPNGEEKVKKEADNSDIDDFVVYGRTVNPKNLENAHELKGHVDFGINISADLFATEEADEGKSFMAVKPWLGNIVPPSDAQSSYPTSAPSQTLGLEWVYGYRAQDAHDNIAVNSLGQLVYPAAAVVVCYDVKSHTQTHFQGHNDDIVCFAQNPADPDIIATGQVATVVDKKATLPHICIWNSKTNESWKIKNAAKRAVRAVGFSTSGKYLASVGDDTNYELTVWDWKSGSKIASQSADAEPHKVFDITWRSDTEFITTGVQHIYFWTLKDGTLKKARAPMKGKFELQTFFGTTITNHGYVAVAGRDGSVIFFGPDKDGSLIPVKLLPAHKGAVQTLATNKDGGLITGSKDNTVIVWSGKLEKLQTFNFTAGIRALYVAGKKLIVGTEAAEIYTIDDYASKSEPVRLLAAHSDGELWGLDVHPSQPNQFVTAGEDNKLILWDRSHHKPLKICEINSKAGIRHKREKASTLSAEPGNRCARAIAFSPDGTAVALGTNEGEVAVYETKQFSRIALHDLNEFSKSNVTNKWGYWIQAIRYSPDGKILAIGTHGSVIVLCDVNQGYKPTGVLTTHNAAIISLDFSMDGKYLQSNCRAYELLFHEIDHDSLNKSKQITHASQLKDVKWATQTCTFGWPVQGIFDPSQDGTDVNCVDRSPDGKLLASGDDYGYVNLYRYPVVTKGNQKFIATGHSSHVQNLKFTLDEKHLLSVGGNDKTILQWKLQ